MAVLAACLGVEGATAFDDPAAPSFEFRAAGPLIAAEVAAFSLQGRRLSDRIGLSDLDVVPTDDGGRLVPLLRLLRLLEAEGGFADGQRQLAFRTEAGPEARLDLERGVLVIGQQETPVAVRTGVSDVTGQGEVFVADAVIGLGLGLEYAWDDAMYAYEATTDRELQLFLRRRPQSRSALSVEVQAVSEALPETEPPARPREWNPVTFVEAELPFWSESQWSRRGTTRRTTVAPAVTVWGNVLDGGYRLRLRNAVEYPRPRPSHLSAWIDGATWTGRGDELVLEAGDAALGLSPLVLPGTSLLGVTWQWAPVSGGPQRPAARAAGGNGRYAATDVFAGQALLGSTAELWVNGRRLATVEVQETAGHLPPGYGRFEFAGTGLLNRKTNEVRIVVRRPDGVTDEYVRDVVSTSGLLPRGQWVLTGGAGTRKRRLSDRTETEGLLVGLQTQYGLLPGWTLGLSAAAQDRFASVKDFYGTYHPQGQQLHIGQQITGRVGSRGLVAADAGFSMDRGGGPVSRAYTVTAEYIRRRTTWQAQLFHFDPEYSNGGPSVSDRRGCALTGGLRLLGTGQLRAGWTRVRNNVGQRYFATEREEFQHAALVLPPMMCGTSAWLQADQSMRPLRPYGQGRMERRTQYTVGLNSSPAPTLSLEARYTAGQGSVYATKLGEDLPVARPGRSYSPGLWARLFWSLGPQSIATTYRRARLQEHLELTCRRSTGRLRAGLTVGRSFMDGNTYARHDLDLDLDGRRSNRLGLQLRYDHRSAAYSAGVSLTLSSLFVTRQGALRPVNGRRIHPHSGGIQGFVYLDYDGNGHRDRGEPGVPAVSVTVDGVPAGESDRGGDFYIPHKAWKDSVAVGLDVESLDAVHTPTQGMQLAYWEAGLLTRVYLGVAALQAVSGSVTVGLPDGGTQALAGARILLNREIDGAFVKDSITAGDGSFYIGGLTAGDYYITLDESTIPSAFRSPDPPLRVAIARSAEPTEIADCNIQLLPGAEAVQ